MLVHLDDVRKYRENIMLIEKTNKTKGYFDLVD